jgi:hypothetical protein
VAHPTDHNEMPFSLDWLAGAAARTQALAACNRGHLIVNGRTCWKPLAFTPDLRALICEFVEPHGPD